SQVAIGKVGLLSAGDMGHSVGAVLRGHGLEVLTCLQGRSERTRGLAAEAGLRDTASVEELVRSVDALLCILVPSEAIATAHRVADAIRATGVNLLYADCNAVAPQTSRAIADVITAAGGRYADGGIIGGPPTMKSSPRIYTSGPGGKGLAELAGYG